jgi:flavin reductase (DIM6/NTAB) family NADH-FMN oxidoreductase RutF
MRKFARNRNPTKATWMSTDGFDKTEPNAETPPVSIDHHETSSPRSSRMTQMVVMITSYQTASLSQKRQNQARRRAMTSSWVTRTSSSPNRLGHGIRRRVATSKTPRKAITEKNVATTDQPTERPTSEWYQTKTAGLAMTAVAVANRVKRRHWSTSSRDSGFTGVAAAGKVSVAIG